MIEKIILSIILGLFLAQTIKLIIEYRKTGKIDLSSYLRNGGMPSAHTASVIALSTSLLIETGWSYYFAIAALMAVIVMNDAMKVRLETGEEAKVLNQVMAKMNIFHRRLAEGVGHTPLQVAWGFVVGIVSALFIYSF